MIISYYMNLHRGHFPVGNPDSIGNQAELIWNQAELIGNQAGVSRTGSASIRVQVGPKHLKLYPIGM
jgi:hypothetical protein